MFDAKEILDPAWLPTYEENIRSIANQMVRLNTNLFVLEKIVGFDFEFFSVIDKTFWIIVLQALYESSVMCAWRIAVDSGKDCLTISRFKNAVIKHIVLPDTRKLLKKELQKISLSRKIGDIKSRIAHLRHTLFAHFVQFLGDSSKPAKPAISAVTLQDLKVIRDEINECVSVLSLGVGFGTIQMAYDPNVIHPEDMDARPDIVVMLDDIAMKSPIVNMPEVEPDFWKLTKANLTQEQINKINHYRMRMGKSPAIG